MSPNYTRTRRLRADMDKELIRCYLCRHFTPIGRGHSGWCQDAKPKIRVNAVDYCDHAEKKGAEV